MGKINIPFNNTNYSIDESALSAAASELKSHLSSVMNGSGAVINLGGIAYNVDSTKLTTEKNDFITRIGKIAGNGSKVVIDGVTYNIDSTKLQTAVSELEVVLGNLHSDDGGSGELVKNEYGFYYNVPYIGFNPVDMTKIAFVFKENNQYIDFTNGWFEENATDLFTYDEPIDCEYGNLTATIFGSTVNFADDGKSFNLHGVNFAIDEAMDVHGVYYNTTYRSQYGDEVVCYDNGTAIITYNDGESRTIIDMIWTPNKYQCDNSGYNNTTNHMSFITSIDGTIMRVEDITNSNKVITLFTLK